MNIHEGSHLHVHTYSCPATPHMSHTYTPDTDARTSPSIYLQTQQEQHGERCWLVSYAASTTHTCLLLFSSGATHGRRQFNPGIDSSVGLGFNPFVTGGNLNPDGHTQVSEVRGGDCYWVGSGWGLRRGALTKGYSSSYSSSSKWPCNSLLQTWRGLRMESLLFLCNFILF